MFLYRKRFLFSYHHNTVCWGQNYLGIIFVPVALLVQLSSKLRNILQPNLALWCIITVYLNVLQKVWFAVPKVNFTERFLNGKNSDCLISAEQLNLLGLLLYLWTLYMYTVHGTLVHHHRLEVYHYT